MRFSIQNGRLVTVGFFGSESGNPPPVPPVPPTVPPTVPPPPPPTTTFTQDQVDRIIGERLKKQLDANKTVLTELETLRSNAKLTQQEKETLEERIATLSKEVFTKEELAKQDFEKATKKSKVEQENLTKERDAWKTKYDNLTIRNALTEASIESKAFSAEQIIDLMGNKAKIVPVLDAEGKETGKTEVKVTFKAMQKDKVVELELEAKEALKIMRENANIYGNLFTYDGKGGAGFTPPSTNANGKIDYSNETEEEFFARRTREKKEGISR